MEKHRRRWGRTVEITQYPHDAAFDEALKEKPKFIGSMTEAEIDALAGQAVDRAARTALTRSNKDDRP